MTQPPSWTTATSRAWSASATAGSRRPATCCWRSPIATAARAWLRAAPVTTAVDHDATARRPRCRSRSPARACASLACPTPSSPSSPTSSVPGWQPRPTVRAAWATLAPTPPTGGTGAAASPSVPDLVVMLFALPGPARRLGAQGRRPGVGPGLHGHGAAAYQRHRRRSSRSASPTASASRRSTGLASWTLDGRERLEFGNLLALGEVLLGYRNEYGLLHRAAAARSCLRSRGRGSAAGPGRAEPARSRPQRQLPRVPPAGARTSAASGGSSTSRPAATRSGAGPWPTRWSAGAGTARPWCRRRPS